MQQWLIWTGVLALSLAVFIPYLLRFRKTHRLAVERKSEARAMGIDRPKAQYPLVDRSLCIGCGACMQACPEGDVLAVVWGAAEVINGERCVGHGDCEQVCPVGALKVGLGDVRSRPDIPLLSEFNETTVPGLFVAGELGGLSLIRHAISQGRMVMEEIARRPRETTPHGSFDVIIVGAGPAGLSAALTAIQHRLSYVILEEQGIGGAIRHYPRRKLVMTQPVEIPLYGWLKQEEYSKEDLEDTWRAIKEKFAVNIRTGERVEDVTRSDRGFTVCAASGQHGSRFVVLAMGRRGTPRRLGVPGESLSKVMYELTDAQSYQSKHLLVVGGGDSAVEAAVGLARQPGNTVTVSYRRGAFVRVKKKNEEAITRLIQNKTVRVLFNSEVTEIRGELVRLNTEQGAVELPNDFVIIQIGGMPPFEMLRRAGIQFGGEATTVVEADARLRNASPASV
jgi:putative YpdA family bacillithiol system oxidoreductase